MFMHYKPKKIPNTRPNHNCSSDLCVLERGVERLEDKETQEKQGG